MQDNQKVVTGCLKTRNLAAKYCLLIFEVFPDFRVDLRSDNGVCATVTGYCFLLHLILLVWFLKHQKSEKPMADMVKAVMMLERISAVR